MPCCKNTAMSVWGVPKKVNTAIRHLSINLNLSSVSKLPLNSTYAKLDG